MSDYNLGTARGVIEIDYRGDDLRRAENDLRGVGKSASSSGSIASKAAKTIKGSGLVIAAGFAVAAKSAWDAAQAASDVEQSFGAVETVFGKYADSIAKKAQGAADAYGLSVADYQQNAALLGSLLKNQGVPMDELAGKTDTLIGRASDLAATFNTDTKTAVEALTSAFKGEFDPLESLGITMKQSGVNAEASALAHKEFGKKLDELSPAQQTALNNQAAMNLIMEQSKDKAGAFAKEADGLAGSQQILAAKFENVKAKLGKALAPAMADVFTFISDKAIPYVEDLAGTLSEKLGPVIEDVKNFLGDMLDKLEPVGDWFRDHKEVLKGAGIALGILAGGVTLVALAMGALAIATSPITLVILAVAALGGWLAYLYKHNEGFKEFIDKKLVPALKAIGQWIQEKVVPALKQMGEFIRDNVLPLIKKWVDFYYGKVIPALWKVGEAIVKFVSGAKSKFDEFKAKISTVKDGVVGVYNSVKTWLGKALNYITGLPGKIGSAFSGLWSGIANGLKSAINSVLHLPLTIPTIDTHIPGVGKVGGQTLIPALANGGVVTSATLALIGEGRQSEAVLPLSHLEDMLTRVYKAGQVNTAQVVEAQGSSAAARSSGGPGSSRLVSGTLSIDRSGRAFIRGVAADEVDGNERFEAAHGRMGRR